MDKSNKEIALELLAAYIGGKAAAGKDPTDQDLREAYRQFSSFVKSLPSS